MNTKSYKKVSMTLDLFTKLKSESSTMILLVGI